MTLFTKNPEDYHKMDFFIQDGMLISDTGRYDPKDMPLCRVRLKNGEEFIGKLLKVWSAPLVLFQLNDHTSNYPLSDLFMIRNALDGETIEDYPYFWDSPHVPYNNAEKARIKALSAEILENTKDLNLSFDPSKFQIDMDTLSIASSLEPIPVANPNPFGSGLPEITW